MSSPSRKVDKLPRPAVQREMQVLVLSAARSGSSSIGQALKTLGYTTFAGMAHNFLADNRFAIWDEAIEARYNGRGAPFTYDDFEKFLGPYEAVSGWGAAVLVDDLVAAYPSAKVILTTRPPDEWVDSFNDSVIRVNKWWDRWRWILPLCDGLVQDFRRNADLTLYNWMHEVPFERSMQRQVYVEHNRRVRELVPSERLLEMDVKEANWEKVCAFLGKDVPENQPWPHAAGRKSMLETMARVWRRAMLQAARRILFGTAGSLGIVALVLRFWFRKDVARLLLGVAGSSGIAALIMKIWF